jgi:hypothetical protein
MLTKNLYYAVPHNNRHTLLPENIVQLLSRVVSDFLPFFVFLYAMPFCISLFPNLAVIRYNVFTEAVQIKPATGC